MGWLRKRARRIRREVRVWRLVARDPRTPRAAKWLLAAAVAYLLSPIDLIPDFVPILGYVDDALVIPLLAALALKMVPRVVIRDARRRAREEQERKSKAKPRAKVNRP